MMNPILELEMKTRMRTWKTAILLTVFLTIIGCILTLFFFVNAMSSGFGASGFDPSIVSTIYDFIAVLLMCILVLIIPVFTATAISGERERQTLDLLLCTDFSPWKIIFGKMSAAICFVILMIVTAMPFMGTTMLFGGVSIFNIVGLVLYYIAACIMLSSIGMFATTHFKKNIVSIIMTYVIMGAMFILPVVILVILGVIESYGNMYNNSGFILENYFYEVVVILFGSNPVFGVTSILNNDFFDMTRYMMSSATFLGKIDIWIISVLYFTIISSFFIFLSKRKLAKVR